MEVQAVNNRSTKFENILSSAVLGGAVAAGAERLLLPAEVKAAIKNTRFGEDVYMKKAANALSKTMQKTGKQFNVETVMENAKNMYPEFKEVATVAKKSLTKTFLGVAGVIVGAKLLAELLSNKQQKKVQK